MGDGIEEDESRLEWTRRAQGAYLLRTNCREQDPRKLWHWYIQLTEVEDAFRLRLVAKPEKLAADLLARLRLKLPSRPKTIRNIVEKN